MVISQSPNQDAIYSALNIFRPPMRRFVLTRLYQAPGPSPQAKIKAALTPEPGGRFKWRINPSVVEARLKRSQGDLEDFLDIGDFRWIVEYYWDEVFSNQFSDNRKIAVFKLREVADARNDVAHPGVRDIEPEYALRSLNAMVYLLRQIGDHTAAEDVEAVGRKTFDLESFGSVRAPHSRTIDQTIRSMCANGRCNAVNHHRVNDVGIAKISCYDCSAIYTLWSNFVIDGIYSQQNGYGFNHTVQCRNAVGGSARFTFYSAERINISRNDRCTVAFANNDPNQAAYILNENSHSVWKPQHHSELYGSYHWPGQQKLEYQTGGEGEGKGKEAFFWFVGISAILLTMMFVILVMAGAIDL